MASWSDVRRHALALPGASEENKSRGGASWLVNGKLFVWERPLRPADITALGKNAPAGPVLGARTADLEMKDVLLAADPKLFFTTPHFDGYPAILIQLDKISSKQLKDVIVEAWLARAPKRAVSTFLHEKKPARRTPA